MTRLKDISRRELIQNLALATAGIGLLPLASCNGKSKNIDESNKQHQLSPFLIQPKEHLDPGPGGIDIRTWIHSSSTNMQFSCVETSVAPMQMGPAPHKHNDLDEIMFVLEGTATVMVDNKVEDIKAGGWHMRPRKIEHTFWNNSVEPLRFFDMYFNQNFEDYLEELFHQIIPDMVKNNLSPASPEIAKRLEAIDKKFGVTMYPEKRQPIIERYGLKG